MTESERLKELEELRVSAIVAHNEADQADAVYRAAHANDAKNIDDTDIDPLDFATSLDACCDILDDPAFMDAVVAHNKADQADDFYRAALNAAKTTEDCKPPSKA